MSSADAALCRAHTAQAANQTWRPPSGALAYPYLVPAGPYTQLWDWDSVFLGCATLSWGSRTYLEGSMANFLAATNLTTGAATGCLTPTLPVACSSDPKGRDVLVHAKPIIVQGAWLAASAPGGDPAAFERFAPAVEALLAFWGRPLLRRVSEVICLLVTTVPVSRLPDNFEGPGRASGPRPGRLGAAGGTTQPAYQRPKDEDHPHRKPIGPGATLRAGCGCGMTRWRAALTTACSHVAPVPAWAAGARRKRSRSPRPTPWRF